MIGFLFLFSFGVFFLWGTKRANRKWKKLLVPENRYEGQIISIETKKYWDSTAGFNREGRFATVEIETKENEKKHVDIYVSNFDVPIGTKIDDVYYNPDLYGYAIVPDRGQQRHATYVAYIVSVLSIVGGIYLLF